VWSTTSPFCVMAITPRDASARACSRVASIRGLTQATLRVSAEPHAYVARLRLPRTASYQALLAGAPLKGTWCRCGCGEAQE
jgi:hypothetical protein